MTKLAIFDCDGTLVDSGLTIHRALERSLATHGHACPPQREAQRVIGLSLVQAMEVLVPAGDHAALAESYKEAFVAMRAKGETSEVPYDGIHEMLRAFAEDGWMLAVATGKSDRGLAHIVAQEGWGATFASLHTADRHPSKPHPSMALAAMDDVGASPANTVLIGDTAHDMRMARAAGVGAIGVDWGYHDEAELAEGGMHALARHPRELLDLSRRWIAGEWQ